jgi:phage shock protein PspC (stress-responsive transcriptional regulator)
MKRLYRSETDRKIAGVCSGIAEYFNVDPAIVRIVFAALVFLWGWGLILYIICWFAVPNKSALPPSV